MKFKLLISTFLQEIDVLHHVCLLQRSSAVLSLSTRSLHQQTLVPFPLLLLVHLVRRCCTCGDHLLTQGSIYS